MYVINFAKASQDSVYEELTENWDRALTIVITSFLSPVLKKCVALQVNETAVRLRLVFYEPEPPFMHVTDCR